MLGISWPLGGLAGLEDQGGVIDRDPVDGRPVTSSAASGDAQPVQQAGQRDVIHQQGHGLGQAGVQVPGPGGQPGRRVGDAAVPQSALNLLVAEAGERTPG